MVYHFEALFVAEALFFRFLVEFDVNVAAEMRIIAVELGIVGQFGQGGEDRRGRAHRGTSRIAMDENGFEQIAD